MAAAKTSSPSTPQAASPGNVIEDCAGTAYVGWLHKSEPRSAHRCFARSRLAAPAPDPITLPIPGNSDRRIVVSAVFPVFGAGSTIYAVAPALRPIGDVIIWTSTNGGESFNAGTIDTEGYSDKTRPSNVLLSGSDLLIGAINAGLGFSSRRPPGARGGNLDSHPPVRRRRGLDLGLDSSGNPVEAYWNLSNS